MRASRVSLCVAMGTGVLAMVAAPRLCRDDGASRRPAIGVAPAFASASAAVSARAAASASAPPRDPDPVPLAADAVPLEPSPRPTAAEWRTATPVAVARRGPEADFCRAYHVREWLKIHCDRPMASIRQLAGDGRDVLLWVEPKTGETLWTSRNGSEIVLPMRRGDRRVFQLFELTGGEWGGVWSEASAVIEEHWLDGEAVPWIVVR